MYTSCVQFVKNTQNTAQFREILCKRKGIALLKRATHWISGIWAKFDYPVYANLKAILIGISLGAAIYDIIFHMTKFGNFVFE